MQPLAPKGQYRVIGVHAVDSLTSPNGPLWKDCENPSRCPFCSSLILIPILTDFRN
jgi:hypothetical protein